MALIEQKLKNLAEKIEGVSVVCLYSTEAYLLKVCSQKIIAKLLSKGEADLTKIDGPAPSIEQTVAAMGTISFFNTKRIVELSSVDPSSVSQADLDALCDLLANLENACVVLTCLFKDEKAKGTKKAKQLLDTAKKHGELLELTKPTQSELISIACDTATALNASLTHQCAQLLIERCKDDAQLIENEVAKLAALSGYSKITPEMIQAIATLNIEADVFEMVRFASAKNKAKTFEKLSLLLQLQNEPIAITAALSGSFVDVYRVKCAVENKKTYSYVHKEYGYKGGDYRLKKAGETASKYTKKQLLIILNILLSLDVALKSSAVDSTLLLQTAMCEILNIGATK